MRDVMRLGVEMIILGTGEERYHKTLSTLQKKYPRQLSVTIGFDNRLAHKIYAGSDIFLMPSQYEPCGLGQLISLRYGTIPVVRRTGGLADTIIEYDPDAKTGNGFVFEKYAPDSLYSAIKRAHKYFQDERHWRTIQRNAMNSNFSWRESALKYVALYREALKRLTGSYA
jgi:starch synthase